MTLPNSVQPEQGLFILRRLKALAGRCTVQALRPVPWFPLIRPFRAGRTFTTTIPIAERKMFYLPGIAKRLDGWWMRHCVESWLRSQRPFPKQSLVDAHFGYPEGVACFEVSRRLGIPCFISLRGVEVDWFQQPPIKKMMVRSLNGAAGVIAVSESLREIAVSHGVASDQITVISNGCESQLFCPGDRFKARQRLGLDRSANLIVCVANFKPVKGHDVLIQAAAKIQRPFRLLLIGSEEPTSYSKVLRALINSLGIETNVEMVGSKPPEVVADYLRASNVFVLPSHREGCCNALIEAISTGCNIVATAVGDNVRLLEGYGAKRIVTPGNYMELAEAIEIALSMDTGATAQIQNPIPSWEAVADQTIEFMAERLQKLRSNQESNSVIGAG